MSPMTEISSTISSTSTTAQRRKIKKPLIEKRRRLRINQCLSSLKSLVLEATNKDENCFPKMEKADILEMTVAYMRTVKHCGPAVSTSGPSSDPSEQVRTYLSGYRACAMEVCRFFEDDSVLPVGVPEARAQLTRHLSGCFQRIHVDLQSAAATDRPGQPSMSVIEPTNCKKRCIEENRLPSPSSSSSSSSSSSLCSSSSPLSFSSPPLPSSNPVADLPRTPLDSTHSCPSASLSFSSSICQVAADPSSRDSKSQSLPSAALQPPSKPKLVRQTPPRLAHQHQYQHQQHLHQSSPLSQLQQQPHLPLSSSECLSPKRGDEFPAAVATTRNCRSVTAPHTPPNQSTMASRTAAFNRLPVDDSLLPWRPW